MIRTCHFYGDDHVPAGEGSEAGGRAGVSPVARVHGSVGTGCGDASVALWGLVGRHSGLSSKKQDALYNSFMETTS